MTSIRNFAVGVVLVLVGAACSASGNGTQSSSAVRGPASAFENREVLGGPYPPGSVLSPGAEGSSSPTTCEQAVRHVPGPTEAGYFLNATGQSCFQLGPSVLDGRSLASADVSYDAQQGGWGVDVTYRGDALEQAVLKPYVNRQVAMVIDGKVYAAPVVNAGASGNNVRINGSFTESTARGLAAELSRIARQNPGG